MADKTLTILLIQNVMWLYTVHCTVHNTTRYTADSRSVHQRQIFTTSIQLFQLLQPVSLFINTRNWCQSPFSELSRNSAVSLLRNCLPLHCQLHHCTSVQQPKAKVMTYWQPSFTFCTDLYLLLFFICYYQ